MNTFLPISDLRKSAQSLDPKRLRNQRQECKALITSIIQGSGWVKHPACKMWIGYEAALCLYSMFICEEILDRGYQDNTLSFFEFHISQYELIYPKWLGDDRLHSSHRSNLLRKDFEWYKHFNWKEPNNLPYFWPEEYNASESQ